MRRSGLALLVATLAAVAPASAAQAQERCARVFIVTLPGVTWHDVARERPPELLRAVADGAAGSVTVRTNSARTTYASGFATIGGGSRLDGGKTTGGVAGPPPASRVPLPVLVGTANVAEIAELAEEARYGAVPGALAEAIGSAPVVAIGSSELGRPAAAPRGHGRWALLAAMNPRGAVDLAAVGDDLLQPAPGRPFDVVTDVTSITVAIDSALQLECIVAIVDPGDLIRADQHELVSDATEGRRAALLAADELIARVRRGLDEERDVLLVVSPTSPAWDEEAHFGVAVAVGPDFSPGSSLVSASTRRAGIVTLPDVAPTVLAHLGVAIPAAMVGRPWVDVAPAGADRLAAAIEIDRESVFVDRLRSPVATIFVIFQVLIYVLIASLIARGLRSREASSTRGLEAAALMIVAFPVCTYLAGIFPQASLGPAGLAAAMIGLDVALVIVVSLVFATPLDRLLALTAFTTAVLCVDLVTGSNLQLNTVFGYSPLVAGRFVGVGNIAFSVLAAATLITGTVIAHRFKGRRGTLLCVGALFAIAVVVDGAPQFGSDVGGVLALVPGFAFTWVLLAGRRPTKRFVWTALALLTIALAAFVAIDLARPPEHQTHLARFVEDVRSRGPEVFSDTVVRKLRANLRVFGSTIWTYLVPPALAFLAWLLFRPRGRWQRLARSYPTLRAGLVGGLVIGVLGFAVNDSGIVVPAMILSFLAPVATLMHLLMEREAQV